MSNINRHEFTVPADVQGFGVWDRMHSPRPQTPLTHDIFWTGVSAGSNSAAQEFLGPFHNESKAINYYAFTGGSLIAHGEDEKERRMSKYRRSVEEVLSRTSVPKGIRFSASAGAVDGSRRETPGPLFNIQAAQGAHNSRASAEL